MLACFFFSLFSSSKQCISVPAPPNRQKNSTIIAHLHMFLSKTHRIYLCFKTHPGHNSLEPRELPQALENMTGQALNKLRTARPDKCSHELHFFDSKPRPSFTAIPPPAHRLSLTPSVPSEISMASACCGACSLSHLLPPAD